MNQECFEPPRVCRRLRTVPSWVESSCLVSGYWWGAAALHLAFASLGAERVTSTAFADNTASRRVSQKFGYTPNGVRRLAVDQHLVEAHDSVLTARRWRAQDRQPIVIEGFDACRHLFCAPDEPEPVDVVLHV